MIEQDLDLRRKITWMMTLRMVIIISLLGSAILIQLVSRTILPINPLYFLIFLTSFFTLVYASFFRQFNLQLMAYLQLSGDVLVITLLVYFTGGVSSSFSFLYILVIITASILLYRRGSFFVASISSLLYGALFNLLYYGVIPFYDLEPLEIPPMTTRFLYYNFFLPIFYFYTTAFLSSYLSERLRRTRTELEEMDEDLSDLKLVHEKILNSMTAGLVLTNLDGRIHFINEAGLHLLGLPVHQILGRPVQNLFVEEIRLPQIKEGLLKQRVLPLERNYRRGKDLLLIGMNMSYMHTNQGNPSGVIVVFQDITDTRKMERQLRLQERMVAIGTMAAGIAHEIRNPLAAIRGSVQLLKDDLNLTDEQQQLMEIVLTESMRLDQTIQNFLNYAKPKELKKESADLKRIVGDMLSFIQKGPDYKDKHSIVFSNSHEDFQHEIDSNQMKQVIWNLSINALKAMPDGGTLRVVLEHDLKGNVFLSFHDEGKGIEPDRLDSIFDPFQNSTTGGSGLGMAIVYRIVQDHNGQILIDSHPGRGTTIKINFPIDTSRAVQPLLQ